MSDHRDLPAVKHGHADSAMLLQTFVRLLPSAGGGEARPPADRQALLDWCDRVDSQVADLQDHCQPGLIHGDAHV